MLRLVKRLGSLLSGAALILTSPGATALRARPALSEARPPALADSAGLFTRLGAQLADSDADTAEVADLLARFDPELWTRLGLLGHEREVMDLRPASRAALRALAEQEVIRLQERQAAGCGPEVDLALLTWTVRQAVEDSRLAERYPAAFVPVGTIEAQGVLSLLQAGQGQAALARLRSYAGQEQGRPALADQATLALRAALASEGRVLPGWYDLVEALQADEAALAQLPGALAESQLDEGEPLVQQLVEQHAAYVSAVRAELLPLTSEAGALPLELLNHRLSRLGVPGDAEAWLDLARAASAEPRPARTPGPGEPDLEMPIRQKLSYLAGAVAQAGLMQLPHLTVDLAEPPEAGEGAMSSTLLAREEGNRFLLQVPHTSSAAEWVLAAEEVVPGQATLQSGVGAPSAALQLFGRSEATLAGWGRYAAAQVAPYLPAEAQATLDRDRVAAATLAMLDLELALGLTSEAQARVTLTERVGTDGPHAAALIKHLLRTQGQAAAAWVAQLEWEDLRHEADEAGVVAPAFHQAALRAGPLPLEVLKPRLRAGVRAALSR